MSGSFRLGSWVVHPELNAISCLVEGESTSVEEVRIEPRVMQVLVHLARHPGEVIPREQFLEEIWNGVFVSDEVLTNAVKELRKALKDDPKSPRFIQTVPKKGYRLIAPVSREGVEPWTGPPLERNPYPGLAPFSESDAGLFFGREDEVETLLEKLSQHHLLALIGPSGVGKSSLLRAGLLPSLPGNWQAVVCHPGERPFSSLAEALVPELPVDTESTKQLIRFDDIDVAVSVLRQWRQKHQEVLVIVDQFEELFTLSPKKVQSRFAELLGRAGGELGIHVLVSMRDDFLIHCHDHPPLAPVFRDLTPLKPPTGDALRRALLEPARLRGCQFEEEALVDEMLEEVSEERGALPLVSFAAARLWEKRDRENHLLTRGDYNEIGGVSGALAQRAEEVLEGLGTQRYETVREIFRNLITAKGTRASRDFEELLSVFDDREDPRTVLNALIDARLLTSFELPSRDGQPASHRIELIHESLLSHWPRLVRWQAQDAEGALLRDQLRQAARIWDEQGRSADLLWAGTAFREFRLWRERHTGGLTAMEEAFARAMVERTNRQRRRRRWAVASVIVFLLGVLAVVGLSRQQAMLQSHRAEASRLVALGRVELDRYPTATLAYARKSLEVADNLEARRLAVEALWRGPTARILPLGINSNAWSAAFSPDGKWLATYPNTESIFLFPADGTAPVAIGGFRRPTGPVPIAFSPDGNSLLTKTFQDSHIHMVSIPDGREIRRMAPESLNDGRRWYWEALPRGILLCVPETAEPDVYRHEIWPYDGGPARIVGALRMRGRRSLDPGGTQIALRRGERIFVRPLVGPITTPEQKIVTVKEGSRSWLPWLVFSPQGDRLVVGEETGRLTLWPLDSTRPQEARIFQMEGPDFQFQPAFDASGSRLVWGSQRTISLWYLDGPPDADPVVLRRPDVMANKQGVFDPRGTWLVTTGGRTLTFWEIDRPQAFVLTRSAERVFQVDFAPDSKTLVACTDKSVRLKALHPQSQPVRAIAPERGLCHQVVVSPDGQQFLSSGSGGSLHIGSISGGLGRWLSRDAPGRQLFSCAFDSSGRQVAAGEYYSSDPTESKGIRVWNLEKDAVLTLALIPHGETVEGGYDWGVTSLAFETEGSLLAAGSGGVRRLDIDTGTSEWIWKMDKGMHASMALSADGRRMLAVALPWDPDRKEDHPIILFDLTKGSERPITSHGNRVRAVALSRDGRLIVSGDGAGIIRVGLADGSEPHLLFGHGGLFPPNGLAVSPDGRWIASTDQSEIRLWPMPDLTKPPLHTLPLEQLLAKLHELTNLLVVEDEASPTGYRLKIGPFPGWETAPEW